VVATLAMVVLAAGSGSARRGPSLSLRWAEPTQGEPEYVLADRRGVVAVSDDGRVAAFGRDGERRWRTDVGEGNAVVFHDLPALGAGLVLVPTNEMQAVALDRRTGTQRWSVPLDGVTSTGVGTAPGGSPVAALVNRSGHLVVVDGETGAQRWSTNLPDFEGDFVAHLWFGADRLLVEWTPTTRGARFAAYDLPTGSMAWSHDSIGATLPSVDGSSVLLAENISHGEVESTVAIRSLDLVSGAERWRTQYTARGFYFGSLASASGADVFAIVDVYGNVRAFDVATGEQQWRRATRREQYEADLRIAGGVVAMSTYGTGLVALSTAGGRPVSTEPVGRVQLGVTIEATAAAGDRLYLLVSRNGEQRDEGEVWAFRASG
jgi:outer membrane protein assembly factor BamB